MCQILSSGNGGNPPPRIQVPRRWPTLQVAFLGTAVISGSSACLSSSLCPSMRCPAEAQGHRRKALPCPVLGAPSFPDLTPQALPWDWRPSPCPCRRSFLTWGLAGGLPARAAQTSTTRLGSVWTRPGALSEPALPARGCPAPQGFPISVPHVQAPSLLPAMSALSCGQPPRPRVQRQDAVVPLCAVALTVGRQLMLCGVPRSTRPRCPLRWVRRPPGCVSELKPSDRACARLSANHPVCLLSVTSRG